MLRFNCRLRCPCPAAGIFATSFYGAGPSLARCLKTIIQSVIIARQAWFRAIQDRIRYRYQWVNTICLDPSPSNPVCEFLSWPAITCRCLLNCIDILSQSFCFQPLRRTRLQPLKLLQLPFPELHLTVMPVFCILPGQTPAFLFFSANPFLFNQVQSTGNDLVQPLLQRGLRGITPTSGRIDTD